MNRAQHTLYKQHIKKETIVSDRRIKVYQMQVKVSLVSVFIGVFITQITSLQVCDSSYLLS